jgi:sterol desaturase/sphingolipid hydroxylase (fatty acid hydroxylase superfamily)
MIQILWDTRGYFFWLLMVSLAVMILERLAPWRPRQKLLRKQFGQDLVWLIFNGHYAGIAIATAGTYLLDKSFPHALDGVRSANLIADAPLAVQFGVVFVLKDLLEWGVHNLLHRVPWLWEFHKLHHSIEELDWIGNFRFHWMEIVVYRSLTYLPIVALGVPGRVVLWIAIAGTVIGHLNHSNLNLTWGPLRYLFNSPRMHVWHHMYTLPPGRNGGVNFGITLSLWDWLFGTSYWPDEQHAPTQQPDRLGFPGIERYPRGLIGRLLYPLSKLAKSNKSQAPPDRPTQS